MRRGQDMKVETDAVLVHVWWCYFFPPMCCRHINIDYLLISYSLVIRRDTINSLRIDRWRHARWVDAIGAWRTRASCWHSPDICRTVTDGQTGSRHDELPRIPPSQASL